MFEQILVMLFDYVDFIFDLFIVLASWFLLHDLAYIFPWCICMIQTCYALWLFVDAKGGQK